MVHGCSTGKLITHAAFMHTPTKGHSESTLCCCLTYGAVFAAGAAVLGVVVTVALAANTLPLTVTDQLKHEKQTKSAIGLHVGL